MIVKNRLNLYYVVDAARELIEKVEGEEYKDFHVPLELIDNEGNKNKYISYSICKNNEVEEAKMVINSFNGLNKDDYIKRNPYCHVTTFPANSNEHYLISFDMMDNYPCKAEISDKYNYVTKFLNDFNKMRNNLIDRNERVKEDDIKQYLDINTDNKYAPKDSIFQKIKRRFTNRNL